ncbi:MAG: cryptochrome/photolyase family protein [Gaiella sp.]
MSDASVVLFTRDLRVHDHPALHAAVAAGGAVVPLFVLDPALLSWHAHPNRARFLCQCLADLRESLRRRRGDLVLRRGDPVRETLRLVRATGAQVVHAGDDVSPYAAARSTQLRQALARHAASLVLHPGVTIVPPESPRTGAGTHYSRFTPFWESWSRLPRRPLLPAPRRLALPPELEPGGLPEWPQLTAGPGSPHTLAGGESRGRARLAAFLRHGLAAYGDGRDLLDKPAAARISADLHFGTLSPLEVERRALAAGDAGAFVRQLCWRDFHHHTALAHPALRHVEIRGGPRAWRRDEAELEAWRSGRTGVPLVDAAMRQLLSEGTMPGRARMVVASFLTKSLLHDWREGLAHFDVWLVDADHANNAANWQWAGGTGTDTRPNRILNPVRQAERFDPDGAYVRRWVPELRKLDSRAIRRPWLLGNDALARLGYPRPLVEHEEAVARFRGATR